MKIGMAAVNEVKCTDEYQMNIDMNDYKKDFATLMAKLEAAEEADNEIETVENPKNEPEKIVDNTIKSHKIKQTDIYFGKGMAAAAVGVTLINAALIVGSKLLRK